MSTRRWWWQARVVDSCRRRNREQSSCRLGAGSQWRNSVKSLGSRCGSAGSSGRCLPCCRPASGWDGQKHAGVWRKGPGWSSGARRSSSGPTLVQSDASLPVAKPSAWPPRHHFPEPAGEQIESWVSTGRGAPSSFASYIGLGVLAKIAAHGRGNGRPECGPWARPTSRSWASLGR